MNVKVKELMLEKFEVMSKASDDCVYILEDHEDLTSLELKHKLYTRIDRINDEIQALEGILGTTFKKVQGIENAKKEV